MNPDASGFISRNCGHWKDIARPSSPRLLPKGEGRYITDTVRSVIKIDNVLNRMLKVSFVRPVLNCITRERSV
jgi:hypothetical protein